MLAGQERREPVGLGGARKVKAGALGRGLDAWQQRRRARFVEPLADDGSGGVETAGRLDGERGRGDLLVAHQCRLNGFAGYVSQPSHLDGEALDLGIGQFGQQLAGRLDAERDHEHGGALEARQAVSGGGGSHESCGA